MSADSIPHKSTLEAAKLLDAELRARADEMEEARRLPADLAEKMASSGIFRMVLPSYVGGLELTPMEMV